MTKEQTAYREALGNAVMKKPNIWFDVSYSIRYDSENESFAFTDIRVVESKQCTGKRQ